MIYTAANLILAASLCLKQQPDNARHFTQLLQVVRTLAQHPAMHSQLPLQLHITEHLLTASL
jgi:hypothetical protein